VKARGDIFVKIDKNEVLRYLGFKQGRTKKDKRVEDLINNTIEDVVEVIEPRYAFDTFRVKKQPQGIEVDNTNLIIDCSAVIRLLDTSCFITIMTVTVGRELETLIGKLFERDKFTEGSIVDAVGSEAVEKAADTVNDIVKEKAAEMGYHITKRFSPGYGGWDLGVQRKLLELSGGYDIGVTVNENDMLIPRKSITAVIGWTRERQEDLLHKCPGCDMNSCDFKGEL